jgi:hypothetical protein
MVKGQYKYVPKEMVEELDRVKLNFNIERDNEGFKKIAENSRIGREIRLKIDMNNIIDFDRLLRGKSKK